MIVHRASNLSAVDKEIVDPCVSIAIGGTQMVVTRSLESDVNPSFEEIFFLRVSSGQSIILYFHDRLLINHPIADDFDNE